MRMERHICKTLKVPVSSYALKNERYRITVPSCVPKSGQWQLESASLHPVLQCYSDPVCLFAVPLEPQYL
jgi:hypothetical protein